jgi:hypothetical protein
VAGVLSAAVELPSNRLLFRDATVAWRSYCGGGNLWRATKHALTLHTPLERTKIREIMKVQFLLENFLQEPLEQRIDLTVFLKKSYVIGSSTGFLKGNK